MLTEPVKPEPWTQDARCAETDPELFFPPRGSNGLAALKVCQGCPVIDQCLDYALQGDESGIWGGTTVMDRLRLQGRRAA